MESNPRPTHYEQLLQHQLWPLPATLATSGASVASLRARFDGRSVHKSCHAGLRSIRSCSPAWHIMQLADYLGFGGAQRQHLLLLELPRHRRIHFAGRRPPVGRRLLIGGDRVGVRDVVPSTRSATVMLALRRRALRPASARIRPGDVSALGLGCAEKQVGLPYLRSLDVGRRTKRLAL